MRRAIPVLNLYNSQIGVPYSLSDTTRTYPFESPHFDPLLAEGPRTQWLLEKEITFLDLQEIGYVKVTESSVGLFGPYPAFPTATTDGCRSRTPPHRR